MIETAQKRNLKDVKFLLGDCENLPFDDNSFDVITCSHSFHHYPNPEKFFASVKRVLKPKGRLIIQDNTKRGIKRLTTNFIMWPLKRLLGKLGDVKIYSRNDIERLCRNSGLIMESYTDFYNGRMQCVIRKPE